MSLLTKEIIKKKTKELGASVCGVGKVYEETNLKIKLIGDFKTMDEHLIPSKKDTVKQIVYFLGEFDDYEKIVFQKEELSGVELVDYEEAIDMFQYESSKRILMEANEFLNKYK